MSRLRIGVIGAGHLGTIHTRLLLQHPDIECLGVADPSAEARDRIRAGFPVAAVSDYRQWHGCLDAAIVATPSQLHYSVAEDLLRQGTHLLIEKPLTTATWQADRLLAVAQQSGAVVQVGHVERFNPAWVAVRPSLAEPLWIESVRHSNYSFRSTDIGSVFDLMIHDLDLVLDLVNSPVVDVQAHGAAIISPDDDVAWARVQFECGTIANFSASRCSPAAARSMRVFGSQGWTSIDFGQHSIETIQITHAAKQLSSRQAELTATEKQSLREEMFRTVLPRSTSQVEPCNAILAEQRDWIDAIRTQKMPRVDLHAGRRAVALAESIVTRIRESGTHDAPATLAPHESLRRAA